MSDLARPKVLRHLFRFADGSSITCAPMEAHRTLDRRHPLSPVEVVWEIRNGKGAWVRYWPDQIVSWELEEI